MTRPDRATAMRTLVEALNAGEAEAAWSMSRSLLAQSPDDPALTQLAATAALRTGRHKEAEELAARSLLGRPDHPPTLILLGRAALALKHHRAAIEALARASGLDSRRPEPAFLLAAARIEAGAADIPRDLRGLAARFPGEASGWEALVQPLLARGEREAVLLCLGAMARLAPSHALAMRRGLICKDLDRAAEARQAFTEATALEPGSVRAWFLLGVSAQDERDDATAEAAYRRALALDPGVAEAAVNLGTVLQRKGDLDGAKAAYGLAVKARPDTFGRVAQAMTTAPKGELWLDLRQLRRSLCG